MSLNEEEDIVETSPNILSLLNRLYDHSVDSPHESDHLSTHSPSPNETLDNGLGTMSSDIRTTLEDRFLDYVKKFKCFYDPQDKNFVHNQYKSNMYGVIAKKLNAEGLSTTGTQLATLFKSMKAKYRDESRRLARMPGELEPSEFYLKFRFMENGLNSVDQRLAKFRTTNGNQIHQKTGAIPTAKEKYASAIANILDSFTPEMKDNFLEFFKALNDLQEPVKHLEKFTCVAQQLKNNPEASVEITNSSINEKASISKIAQKSIDSDLGELIPDLQSIGQTFEGQKDLLALFRVLGNVITKLPVERRHSHLQGLLNISSAALNVPVQINWKSEVFQPIQKTWAISNNSITIDGPSPNEMPNHVRKDSSIDVTSNETKRVGKRTHQNEQNEQNESDEQSIMTDVTDDEASTTKPETNRRLPRAAKERSFVRVSPVNKRRKRR
ncbi:hypothetical protein M3Y97_00232800 [Aphelenchoides bicaudatus]|nr:hypothetical protein M3Y97_00232800 [Aphelenchoides bicaudatus]